MARPASAATGGDLEGQDRLGAGERVVDDEGVGTDDPVVSPTSGCDPNADPVCFFSDLDIGAMWTMYGDFTQDTAAGLRGTCWYREDTLTEAPLGLDEAGDQFGAALAIGNRTGGRAAPPGEARPSCVWARRGVALRRARRRVAATPRPKSLTDRAPRPVGCAGQGGRAPCERSRPNTSTPSSTSTPAT